MAHPLTTSLSITIIGMTLLFLALILFYGLMSSMMSILHRRTAAQSTAGEDVGDEPEPSTNDVDMMQAAAIVVALARAEVEQGRDGQGLPMQVGVPAEAVRSAWWTLHHQRQLAAPSARRRTQ